ncbi:MAG: YbaB/EbfC family nucleoid-associated protein [Pirellulales bacterium]
MFKGLGDLAGLLKNAQQIRQQLEQTNAQLEQKRVEGSAGGGMVVVEATGKQAIVNCRISPELFDQKDRELIEELVVAAANQALDGARRAAQEEMAKIFGGLTLPGVTDVLSQLGNTPPKADGGS